MSSSNNENDTNHQLQTINNTSSNNNTNNIDDDDEIPNIPSIPSITTSTSETEEERRRILEGIFAEQDEDSDDDDDDEEGIGVSAFMNVANRSDYVNNNDNIGSPVSDEDYGRVTKQQNLQGYEDQLLPPDKTTPTSQLSATDNAYLSSSSDDDDDGEYWRGGSTKQSNAPAPSTATPKFSNTNNISQQQQQPDLTEATLTDGGNTKFSWIDSSSHDQAEDNAASASASSAPPPSHHNQHKTQQQQKQQSAFDRALNEVQQGGGRSSRSNSFNFNIPSTSGEAEDEEGEDGASTNQEGVGSAQMTTTSTVATKNEEQEQQEEEEDDDGSEVVEDANDEDDFFAKAEHTVLDEIFSENPDNTDELSSAAAAAVGTSGIMGKSVTSTASSNARMDQFNDNKGKTSSSSNARIKDRISLHTSGNNNNSNIVTRSNSQSSSSNNPLPDVLSSMRQKIESFNIFDGDSNSNANNKSISGRGGEHYPPSLSNPNNNTANQGGGSQQHTNKSNTLISSTAATTNNNNTSTAPATLQKYYNSEEERESMRRAFQQSISAAVLVSLAHKRYERRRLAAMEIEKVVRSLVLQEDYSRVRAILLLLSDDYVRSTNEDARKGGAVALAACAIGLKKANEKRRDVIECRDLILASVVHACQDHSQRVRYYATESLFNVTKVIPSLAVQHFFILFEILRSLYADVDLDVRSGAELLDKKLKEVIVGAINSGSFSADACVPVFARFVYMRNKATKQLTLTWLKEFSEKLVGAPILEFLHLFLGGVFQMVADPNATSQLALEFLQSVLPKLLVTNEEAFEDAQQKVDFDKILQSLVITMEHPDPFVRKVAMYWMSRIVQAHMSSAFPSSNELNDIDDPDAAIGRVDLMKGERSLSAASISVRNALPHVLPGILLSIGDTHQSRAKDSFLPDQTTHSLAEQANTCLQDAVRRDGQAFIPHLGGFIVALREELDSPGGLIARNPPSVERRPYRMDVKTDGSGIESTGWFRASDGVEERDNALILSRLCALQWVVVLYEHVVPNSLKADYASEFIDCIIYQLVDQPPGIISECLVSIEYNDCIT